MVGKHTLKLFLMCDAYMGCDQELDLVIDVKEAESESEGEEGEEEGEEGAEGAEGAEAGAATAMET